MSEVAGALLLGKIVGKLRQTTTAAAELGPEVVKATG
jgi:hypothetical protein